ncbi:MAG TPA: class I SAM-dependent methyltransferase [Rubrobacteraceae bacterium]|nr:class I SAM-dependent methyltransferase [Rubrobacteraceae bacterium]
MPEGLYKEDPLTPDEREEYESDLIAFCDRELDLLGDIEGLNVLYAGGASPLWLEGLARRVGPTGHLTALELDPDQVSKAADILGEADLPIPVRLAIGDVFELPFEPRTFDLVYSAGLFHELDKREEPAEEALSTLARSVRAGGRVATGDFIDSVAATQLEDEEIQAEWTRRALGREFYGIGPPERLVALHETVLDDVRWRISPPYPFRHLDKLVLDEDEPAGFLLLPAETVERLRERRSVLRERIEREGYTRPATLYVEGFVAGD